MSIAYARETALSAADYIAVIGATYMRDHRPIANVERIARILAGSNMVVTARDETGEIVGLGRGISDGEWVVYLADLAVRPERQRQGIGRGILRKMKEIIGPGMGIVLVAYPAAVEYYKRIGLGEMPAFYVDREVRT